MVLFSANFCFLMNKTRRRRPIFASPMTTYTWLLGGSILANMLPATSHAQCPSTVQYLESKLPQFSDPQLAAVRSGAVGFSIEQAIAGAKSRGQSADDLVAALNARADQAAANVQTAGECVVTVTANWSTDDEFLADLNRNMARYQSLACSAGTTVVDSCICAAIGSRIGAVAYRAATREVACMARIGQF